MNSAFNLYNVRVRENLNSDSVYANYSTRSVKYKASKMWYQLPSSLKEFFPVKYFSNKLNEFLQAVDIQYFLMYANGRVCFFCISLYFLSFEKFRLSMSVCCYAFSSVCL